MNVLHAPCLQLHRPFFNPSNMPRSRSSAGPLPVLTPPFLLSHPGPYCLSNPIHSSRHILDIFSKQTLHPKANYLFLCWALSLPGHPSPCTVTQAGHSLTRLWAPWAPGLVTWSPEDLKWKTLMKRRLVCGMSFHCQDLQSGRWTSGTMETP